MACNCWVAAEAADVQSAIRYGAHALECPTFRESGDELDRKRDKALREHNELHIMDDDAEENAKRGRILRIM